MLRLIKIMKNKKLINNSFSSLKSKDFRIYWIGMCISLTGTWMQKIAQPWLVYSLTRSPLLLSLTGVLQFVPILILTLFAGALIDRFPKRNILIFTQSLSLIITMFLSVLVWTGKVQYWHILLTATVLGITNAIDMPSRQAIVIDLVGKDELLNGVALNFIAFNLTRVLGPIIAVIIMEKFGAAFCFFSNSFSFLVVVISLSFIKCNSKLRDGSIRGSIISEIKNGINYILHERVIFILMIILMVMYTFAPNFSVLLPVFTKEVLKQNEAGFSVLMSFIGGGAFLGAIFVSVFSSQNLKLLIILIMPFVIGSLLIFVSCISSFFMSKLLFSSLSFSFVVFTISANSILQIRSSDVFRSRVMSVYTLVSSGTAPVGNLYAGMITEYFDVRVGFFACGVIIISFVALIYIKKALMCFLSI